jgi:hypothetical protein
MERPKNEGGGRERATLRPFPPALVKEEEEATHAKETPAWGVTIEHQLDGAFVVARWPDGVKREGPFRNAPNLVVMAFKNLVAFLFNVYRSPPSNGVAAPMMARWTKPPSLPTVVASSAPTEQPWR